MSVHYMADNANDVWSQAAKQLLEKKGEEIVLSRSGETTEILHATFSIENPRERWVCSKVPSISIAFALAEVVAIINGCNDAYLLNNWNPALCKYQGGYKKYPGAYGYRLKYNYGFNQIERAYNTLKNNPNSRQVVMTIWDPNIDLPKEGGKPNNNDIPCNICSILKVRNNKLYWTQMIRSNDISFGVPYNFVQFTYLQEIIAGWLGLELGEYLQVSDSLHLYNNKYMNIVERELFKNTDSIYTNKEDSKKYFKIIYENMIFLCSKQLSEKDIREHSSKKNLPSSFNNILIILAGYVALKRGYKNFSNEIISSCTNILYKQLWNIWLTYNGYV